VSSLATRGGVVSWPRMADGAGNGGSSNSITSFRMRRAASRPSTTSSSAVARTTGMRRRGSTVRVRAVAGAADGLVLERVRRRYPCDHLRERLGDTPEGAVGVERMMAESLASSRSDHRHSGYGSMGRPRQGRFGSSTS
jgi:hypothetical protein